MIEICIQVIHSGGTKIKFPNRKENAGHSKKIPGQFQLNSKTIIKANSNTWFAKGIEIFLNLKQSSSELMREKCLFR
jgi:hypothetical protein